MSEEFKDFQENVLPKLNKYISIFKDMLNEVEKKEEKIKESIQSMEIGKKVAELHKLHFTPIQELVNKEDLKAKMRDEILNTPPRKTRKKLK